jgi:hypothetical protein
VSQKKKKEYTTFVSTIANSLYVKGKVKKRKKKEKDPPKSHLQFKIGREMCKKDGARWTT